MSKVEYFCSNNGSYMPCYVDDFEPSHSCYHVSFEDDFKPSQWVHPDKLSFCPSPRSNWRPKLGETVECEAKFEESTPWSWFPATVCGISKSKTAFLVRFRQTKQKEMMPIESLRAAGNKRRLPQIGVHIIYVRLPFFVMEDKRDEFRQKLSDITAATGMVHMDLVGENQVKMIGRITSMRASSLAIVSLSSYGVADASWSSPRRSQSSRPRRSMSGTPSIRIIVPDNDVGTEETIRLNLPNYLSNGSATEEEMSSPPVGATDLAVIDEGNLDESELVASRWIELFQRMVREVHKSLLRTPCDCLKEIPPQEVLDSVFHDFRQACEHPLVHQWICESGTLDALVETLGSRGSHELGSGDIFSKNVDILWSVYVESLHGGCEHH